MNKDQILTILHNNIFEIKQFGVARIGLFGSYLKDQHTKGSDIDILVHFEEQKKTFDDNERQCRFFEATASEMAGWEDLEYNSSDFPSRLADKLERLASPNANILFDISTCASFVFYPVMKALLSCHINLTIVYAEAQIYYPDFKEWQLVLRKAEKENSFFIESFENAEFQSAGINEVYPSHFFAERNPGNKPSFLVAVPNFSAMRMNAIIARDREVNKTSNDNIFWLVGEPPAAQNRWRMEAVNKTNNLDNVSGKRISPVSTLYYKKMIEALEDIYLDNRHQYHMTIGSLGSKMQHVGTFLFLFLHQEVGFWMAEPKRFKADRFSSGIGKSWQLRFGPTDSLVQKLSKYLTFEWQF